MPSFSQKFFYYRASITLIVLVGALVAFVLFTPNHIFLNEGNLLLLGKLIPDLGIVALGIGMLMICGEYDLSVGSTLPLCAFVFISLLQMGMNLLFTALAVLGVGALLGLLNAVIVIRGQITSFIATLGTMMFWRGILYIYSLMMPIPLRPYLPAGSSFEYALTGRVGGIVPIQVIWFTVFALILGVFLHYHRFGNWVYATGDNKEAARAMGINTDRVKTICFMIVGALAGFVAILQILRLESFAATQGLGYEFKAIAAAVVGGTSLRGGIGSMAGIFLGALITQILEDGLILMGVPVFGINAFIGALVVLFVLLDAFLQRRMRMR